MFASEREEPTSNEKRWVELRRASDTKIKRPTVIRADANPLDPAWEAYFEDRIGAKMKDNLAGRKRLLHIMVGGAG